MKPSGDEPSSAPLPLGGRGVGGEGPRPIVHVAVGVLVRADRAVLLADRPAGKPYAGYWEFPGGKIERGESVEHALARELAEELHVTVAESFPWVVFEFDYPHAYVRLHFRRVFEWSGAPAPLEGQRLMFHLPGAPPPQPLLPAACPAMRWLQLPERLGWRGREAPAGPEPAEVRIDGARWLTARVRDRQELAHAVALGADFVVAPVTAGRDLAELCCATPVPVYAAGAGDAQTVRGLQRLGAHGVLD